MGIVCFTIPTGYYEKKTDKYKRVQVCEDEDNFTNFAKNLPCMFKNILNTLFTKFFFSGIGFLVLVIVSHSLGTQGKGEQAIIAFNVYVSMLVFTLIGNSTLIYLTPRKDFSSLFFPSLSWIVVCSLIMFFFAGFKPWLTVPIAFLGALAEINYYVLMGKEKIVKANGVKLIISSVNIAIIGTMAIMGTFDDVIYYVYALLCAHFAGFCYGLFCLRKEYFSLTFPSFESLLENFKILFSLGFVKQIGTIAQTFTYRLSFYVLALYCGTKQVGIYSNACSLGEAVMLFGTSLALVQYSKLSNTSDKKEGMKLTIDMTKANMLFTFLALMVLCFLPKGFWTIAFGQGFEEVGIVIRYLAAGLLLLSCSSNFTQYFASKGNFTISMYAALAGLALTLVLVFWLVPLYGMLGAALTACLSYSLTFTIEFIFFLKWKSARK